MLVISLLIKLDSRGPLFYRGARVGKNGVIFRPYKFRTMVNGAEMLGGSTTADGDCRITGVGKFLRKYKIDELPQLINILKGEMSFVGPRPELEEHVKLYTEEQKVILTVLPGLTDYSSMKFASLDKEVGKNNADEFFAKHIRPEKNRLRVLYARNHSFFGDLGIIFKTILIIFKKIKE
jgi:lipopolysaccharide/colanic/teichoic acid biosynthesis glycosyltransferase